MNFSRFVFAVAPVAAMCALVACLVSHDAAAQAERVVSAVADDFRDRSAGLRIGRALCGVRTGKDAGIEPVGSTPEQLTAVIKAEMATLGKVIKNAGIRVE